MSCRTTSREALAKTIPVSPPKVNRNRKPPAQYIIGQFFTIPPLIVAIHLKTFTPVGIAIIKVTVLK